MKTCNIMEYVHDLKKFIEAGKYYALEEPVPVGYNGEVFNVGFLSLDTDEYVHDLDFVVFCFVFCHNDLFWGLVYILVCANIFQMLNLDKC